MLFRSDLLTPVIADLMTPDIIENFNSSEDYRELRDDLAQNSVEAWEVNSLLRFYHGNADNTVPINQSQSIYDNFISLGMDAESIEFFELEGLNHDEGVLPWGINSIIWFDQLKSEQESF